MSPQELRQSLGSTALALRGYDIANLGRTPELLAHAKYGEITRRWLQRASTAFEQCLHRPVDLVARVAENRETTSADYSEAIALVIAMEQAQLEMLRNCFDINFTAVRLSFGYSLGEIAAVIASGILEFEDALRIPLELSADCLSLTEGVSLAVLLTKATELPMEEVQRTIVHVNSAGQGAMGISTLLSPNAALVMGQHDTLDRFRQLATTMIHEKVFLRKRDEHFPPLHTCLTWQKAIPNRAALMMQTLPFHARRPEPPILSMVTGLLSYNDHNFASVLARWVDHPQRVWDVTTQSLAMSVETVIHVGPAPNLLVATWSRLADNIDAQTRGSIGMRALAAAAQRPWLAALLPQQTSLLRAPHVKQVILEDWLLENG